MEIRRYLAIVLKHWWLILLTIVLAAVAAFVYSSRQLPIYRSTTTLEVDRESDPRDQPYYVILSSERVAETYVLQVASSTVMEEVVVRLGLDMSAGQAQGYVSAALVVDTSMINVSATHTDPAFAQALANTTAQVFIQQKMAQQQSRYQTSLDELESQVAELEASTIETQRAIVALGDRENLTNFSRMELATLETQLANDQIRLSIQLRSAEDFRLAMARYANYISVFKSAELPAAPIGPQTMRNTALAAVVGAMIGVGVAFLLDYLDDTIHSPEEAQRELGINALGALPKSESLETGRIAAEAPLSAVAEAFRSLRTNFQYFSLDKPLRTLLVTSSVPSDGKTFVASNLATVFALAGKKVLLMDADLRRARMHRLWAQAREPGLAEALTVLSEVLAQGQTPDFAFLEDVIQLHPTGVDGLHLLTAGAHVPNPSELLASQTFRRLLELLMEHFDLIIVDSPPILAVTDAVVLANRVDGVALVVNSGESRLPVVARALERLISVDANVLGVIVNRMTSGSGGYYYHYYYYQHDYTYGHDNGHGESEDGQSSDREHAERRVKRVRRRTLAGDGKIEPVREDVYA